MKKLIPMINEAGRHASGKVTRKCDAALAAAVFVKKGTDDNHVAVTTAPTECPLGLTTHATDAIEDEVGVELPGASEGTKLATASAAIDVNDRICATAAGKAVKLPAGAGTYYVIGRAITAASGDGVDFEFEGCAPYPVVVAG
jgi:hypothetical protein